MTRYMYYLRVESRQYIYGDENEPWIILFRIFEEKKEEKKASEQQKIEVDSFFLVVYVMIWVCFAYYTSKTIKQ